MKYSRDDYMNKKCSFDEYYSQFVTTHIKHIVESAFGKDNLIIAYEKDIHLNSIPLIKWDKLALKVNGNFTLAEKVCILKTAAKQIIRQS